MSLYGPVVILLKAAIVVQILRVFVPDGMRNYTFWAGHTLLWVNTLIYTVGTFMLIFRCWPVSKLWNVLEEGGRCSNVRNIHVISSALNAASDLLILALPQPAIWRLRLPKQKKRQISAVFMVGVLYVYILCFDGFVTFDLTLLIPVAHVLLPLYGSTLPY
jgi:hypothetical protein